MVYEEPIMEIVPLEEDIITLVSGTDPNNGSEWGAMI